MKIQIRIATPRAGLDTIEEIELKTFSTHNGLFAIYRGQRYRVHSEGLNKYIVILS